MSDLDKLNIDDDFDFDVDLGDLDTNIENIDNIIETINNNLIEPPVSLDSKSVMKTEDKYGDDTVYESWADVNIFAPIATELVDPLHNIGLTPNMVTIISTIFTIMGIYYFYSNKTYLAVITYMTGYLLDCVDGRMARKYAMGSDIGMALDCVSDNISNGFLILYMLLSGRANLKVLSVIIILTFMLSLSFGLNEAIASYNVNGSDNFYEYRSKQLEGKEDLLFKLFLFITKSSYSTYKLLFPTYDIDKINKWLRILKHFGPGNYCLFISSLLLIL